MTHSLFISDLHLCSSRPHITRIFLEFLKNTAPGAEVLYILGDLFEYWAGDDDRDNPEHAPVLRSLSELKKGGVSIYLMHGNRDFLMGKALASACGAELLPDPYPINLYGTPTLLMHGDTLCTDDVDYQKFRAMVRNPAWQSKFLSQSLVQRKQIIEDFRKRSEIEKGKKKAEIMDVNVQTVESTLRNHGYPRLIHGHTHRPARHVHSVDGKNCERWVLTDWYEHGGYLRCDASGCEAINLYASAVS
jgi:UDP-2,3-diacylglucosamine hydrolase